MCICVYTDKHIHICPHTHTQTYVYLGHMATDGCVASRPRSERCFGCQARLLGAELPGISGIGGASAASEPEVSVSIADSFPCNNIFMYMHLVI